MTDDNSTIYLTLHLAETLLKDLDGAVLHSEVTESPIVTIEKNGCWHFLAFHGFNSREFIFLDFDILNLLGKVALVVVETNVDSLLSENSIGVLAVFLSDAE